jgi:hypothetical protein
MLARTHRKRTHLANPGRVFKRRNFRPEIASIERPIRRSSPCQASRLRIPVFKTLRSGHRCFDGKGDSQVHPRIRKSGRLAYLYLPVRHWD